MCSEEDQQTDHAVSPLPADNCELSLVVVGAVVLYVM